MPALIQTGRTGTTVLDVTNNNSAKVAVYPNEASGYFSHTGIAAVTTSPTTIYSFRWAPNNGRVAAIRKISMSVSQTAGTANSNVARFDAIRNYQWLTAATGGSNATYASIVRNKVTNDLSYADIRYGTLTLTGVLSDTQPFSTSYITAGVSGGAVWPLQTVSFFDMNLSGHPMVLENNEGFSIVCQSIPGTSNFQTSVTVVWQEMTAFN